ncbi:hypothetical protein Q9233_008275 [Columba guinea]|nr:hypothetical protein Q9233_008275 [Columba guinea]
MRVDAQGSRAHGQVVSGLNAELAGVPADATKHQEPFHFLLKCRLPGATLMQRIAVLICTFSGGAVHPKPSSAPGCLKVMLREGKQDFGLSYQATVAVMLHPKRMLIKPQP